MHVAHEVVHVLQGAGGWRNEDVHAGVDDRQVTVGDDDGHFDEGVIRDVQAGHLAVNPDQGVFQCFHVLHGSALLAIRSGGALGGVATTTLEGYWKEHPCPLVLT